LSNCTSVFDRPYGIMSLSCRTVTPRNSSAKIEGQLMKKKKGRSRCLNYEPLNSWYGQTFCVIRFGLRVRLRPKKIFW